jgi:hypothetical protein
MLPAGLNIARGAAANGTDRRGPLARVRMSVALARIVGYLLF